MKQLPKVWNFGMVALLALLISGTADARPGRDRDGHGSFAGLNLTQEQKDQITKIKDSSKDSSKALREKTKTLREQKKTAREKLKSAFESDSSEDAITSAHNELLKIRTDYEKARTELEGARFNNMLEIRKVLTKEQREQIRNKWHEKGKGKKHGRWNHEKDDDSDDDMDGPEGD